MGGGDGHLTAPVPPDPAFDMAATGTLPCWLLNNQTRSEHSADWPAGQCFCMNRPAR